MLLFSIGRGGSRRQDVLGASADVDCKSGSIRSIIDSLTCRYSPYGERPLTGFRCMVRKKV